MPEPMTPHKILKVGGEVSDLVLKNTTVFIEAVNILYAAKCALAGGLKDGVQADLESLERPSVTP